MKRLILFFFFPFLVVYSSTLRKEGFIQEFSPPSSPTENCYPSEQSTNKPLALRQGESKTELLGDVELKAGVASVDLTPPLGTPSAGYAERRGAAMEGVHDPLLAIALLLDNGEKKIAFCSVDHLGFTYPMVQEIVKRTKQVEGLGDSEIYIGSSHTHSGGGAFLDIPTLGKTVAGAYQPEIVELYIEKTVLAIVQAWQNRITAKVGIGYGKAPPLSRYRSQWPPHLTPLSDIALIKVEKEDGTPLAALFNFPVHPTVLNGKNFLFSADFVGYTRTHLSSLLVNEMQALYFNGAQGDIAPLIADESDLFHACETLGQSLAEAVAHIWEKTPTSKTLEILTQKQPYEFVPQPTPSGLFFPVPLYRSEMNLLVLNKIHAFLSIPGELSCAYDERLKAFGDLLGYRGVSIFGLTNDAHGYIILPEAWRHKTSESHLSFGGEQYGEETEKRAHILLKSLAPISLESAPSENSSPSNSAR